ncbi:hypothetical protein COCC4DRAFT_50249 [Bipolaris maydis ATCC 48331]|uniref:Uncharacterized protein n=1 Tax=Cochliobolus heterostrophus (strain C4 / ATCC 48331 / race T) TaxID=665024 RepID=N4XK39_COCH4|nr:uncharacterized protein COCC4DRAFT_50249 [Bipolaris maydis ATCC 48331]ENI05497.1 hypothetical protein COCC4DRAFT_50249 [Bipolaris maydis ATCC 48331]KAJ5063422.1 hypothetical protein J3E74DRAFT_416024 [Bipolaris maydis]KAJ6199685.1 hypothetical protein J3E72DRAFT_383879 [Bipolaris maydis]
MSSVATRKVVNSLSPARRVPDMRGAAKQASVAVNPIRLPYKQLQRSNKSTTKPRTKLAASRQNLPTANGLTSRTRPSASATRVPQLHARSRADYKQNGAGAFSKTKIPRPTVVVLKEARIRQSMEFWVRSVSVVRTPKAKLTSHSADQVAVSQDCEDKTPKNGPIEADSEILQLVKRNEANGAGIDDSSLLFNDKSFDECVDADQQTTTTNPIGRELASMKRLGLGLRIHRLPWFVGLAHCPQYKGEGVTMPHVRPRRGLAVKEQGKELRTITAPSNPPKDGVKTTLLPSRPATKGTTLGNVVKVTKPASSAPAKSDKAATTTKPQGHGKRHLPATTPPRASRRCSANIRTTPLSRRQKPVAQPKATGNHKPRPSVGRHLGTKQSATPSTDKKPLDRGAHAVKPALKPTARPSSPATIKKQVAFAEGPIKPRFFSAKDTVKQSASPDTLPSRYEWVPLVGLLHSRPTSVGSKTSKMFQSDKAGSLTLKRRFLLRFASVQAYEAKRREEALARGEQPGLGQLDYGNAAIKIALQASGVVEADDIGILQDLSGVGRCGLVATGRRRMANPVWVFGSFKEPTILDIVKDDISNTHRDN